jgi:hypothetical protein
MEEPPDPLRHGTEIRLWQVPGFDQCSFGSSEGGAQRWWWVKFGMTKNSRIGADVGSKGATTSDGRLQWNRSSPGKGVDDQLTFLGVLLDQLASDAALNLADVR